MQCLLGVHRAVTLVMLFFLSFMFTILHFSIAE
jgi:hypothetical protein